jgi:uncharacterized protein (DUF4415 family)
MLRYAKIKPVSTPRVEPAAAKAEQTRPVTIRMPADVLDAWRATGPGWQTRMNALLREHKP